MRSLFCVRWATRMHCLRSNQSVNRRIRRIPVSRLIQKSVRILRPVDNLQNGATDGRWSILAIGLGDISHAICMRISSVKPVP